MQRIALVCMLTLILAVLSTGGFASATAGSEPTVSQIIEDYIEALGGQAALERLETRESHGHVYTDLSWHDPQIEIQRFQALIDNRGRFAVTLENDAGTLRYGYDGATEWRHGGDEADPIDGDGRGKIEWLMNPRGALELDHYYPDLTVAGNHNVSGHNCWVLQPGDRDATYYALFFDKDSGLLRAIGYHWFISDYREVDGVLVPFRIECGRKGGATNYVVDSIVHNVEIDPQAFAVPDVSAGV